MKTDDKDIECYKIAVESAEKNSDRRELALGGYMAIMAIVIGAIISIITKEKPAPWYVLLILGLVGVATSVCYYKLIGRFSALSEAKFKVISEIEEKLPAKIFSKEWSIINPNGKYVSLSKIERIVTVVLGLACLILVAAGFIGEYAVTLVITPHS